jgi:hypothetical protein
MFAIVFQPQQNQLQLEQIKAIQIIGAQKSNASQGMIREQLQFSVGHHVTSRSTLPYLTNG